MEKNKQQENIGAAAQTPPAPPPSSTTTAPAIKKKAEDRSRKKDPKSWENVSKKLNECSDSESKLKFIEEKYNELYNEYRKVFASANATERNLTAVQKEKEQLDSDLGKFILVKSRLENLCRELQKQNKQIKEESVARIKIEEERRKEISSKFAEKLNDINNLMEESKVKGDRLSQENRTMTEKLTEMYKEFQKRERDIAIISKELDNEKRIHQEAINALQLELANEKHHILKEQIILKTSLEQSETNCKVLMNTVKDLQSTIDFYKTQYKDFESAMNRSDEVLTFFKGEMQRLNKQAKKFDDDSQGWRKKYQDTLRKLIELSENNQSQEQLITSNEKKVEQLQKLCRQLQSERSTYLKLLKDNGITVEVPQIVEPPPCKKQEPVVKAKSKPKTKKELQLEECKRNLKALQNDLNALTKNQKSPETAEETIEGNCNDSSKEILENIVENLVNSAVDEVSDNNSSLVSPEIDKVPTENGNELQSSDNGVTRLIKDLPSSPDNDAVTENGNESNQNEPVEQEKSVTPADSAASEAHNADPVSVPKTE